MRDWLSLKSKDNQHCNNTYLRCDQIREERQLQEKIKTLQQALEKGLSSGIAEEFDIEQIIQNMNNP